MIVLPAIDLRGGRVVRLRQGQADQETVYDDDPAAVARRWVAQGAEWLHVVNLDGALGGMAGRGRDRGAGRPDNLQRLQEICAAVPATPVQFGGGLRSLEDIERALELGAVRVVLGTVAVQQPDLVAQALSRYGAERIGVSIDVRDGQVATHGWCKASGTTASALGRAMRERGVRYAVYTDIRRDGVLCGLDVEAAAALAQATGLRIIAAGGAATLADLRRLRLQAEAGIEGVIIGQALYCRALSLPEAIRIAT